MLYLNTKPCIGNKSAVFNFNKCCIWIDITKRMEATVQLFNFNKCCIWMHLYQRTLKYVCAI